MFLILAASSVIFLIILALIKGVSVTLTFIKYILNLRVIHALAIGAIYMIGQNKDAIDDWISSMSHKFMSHEQSIAALPSLESLKAPELEFGGATISWPKSFEPALMEVSEAIAPQEKTILPVRVLDTPNIDTMKVPSAAETEGFICKSLGAVFDDDQEVGRLCEQDDGNVKLAR